MGNAVPVVAEQTEAPTNDTPAVETPESFDKWISAQPETIRGLFDSHIDGLKSALEGERTTRKTAEKELRKLSALATDGSELKTQLERMAADAEVAEKKATFYADAHEAGVKNLRVAWAAAKELGTHTRSGDVDFAKLKEVAPELFASTKTPVPPANAGNGAGQQGVVKAGMNDFIRNARR
jgi:hypothetical protein